MIATACAIAGDAIAQESLCEAPARIEASVRGGAAPRDYHAVFQQCSNARKQSRLAIRRMNATDHALLLTVDPETLTTSLEHEGCWVCADTTDEAQAGTRYMRAVSNRSRGPGGRADAAHPSYLRNAGLSHGAGGGAFITADLCPTSKPLDRGFMEGIERLGPNTPVALSISGLWLTRHAADFQWLRERARAGAFAITWVNHSFHHPYVRGRPIEANFMLAPGVDAQAEILENERLLIAHGETPSVFFRFPGLVSDDRLMETVRRHHLVTLGADAWLVFAPSLQPGAIVLVHANGNEPDGIRAFSRLAERDGFTRPFRAINEAPEPAPAQPPQLPQAAESAISAPWPTTQPPPTPRSSPSPNSRAR